MRVPDDRALRRINAWVVVQQPAHERGDLGNCVRVTARRRRDVVAVHPGVDQGRIAVVRLLLEHRAPCGHNALLHLLGLVRRPEADRWPCVRRLHCDVAIIQPVLEVRLGARQNVLDILKHQILLHLLLDQMGDERRAVVVDDAPIGKVERLFEQFDDQVENVHPGHQDDQQQQQVEGVERRGLGRVDHIELAARGVEGDEADHHQRHRQQPPAIPLLALGPLVAVVALVIDHA